MSTNELDYARNQPSQEDHGLDPLSLRDHSSGLIEHGRHDKIHTRKEPHDLVYLSRENI